MTLFFGLWIFLALGPVTHSQASPAGEVIEVNVVAGSSKNAKQARMELAIPFEGFASPLAQAFSKSLAKALNQCPSLQSKLIQNPKPIELVLTLTATGVQGANEIDFRKNATLKCLETELSATRWQWIPLGSRPIEVGLRIFAKKESHDSE